MINGVTKLNLDVKGRLAIPSRYRERLMQDCAGRLVVTLDPERRMVIYPYNEWQKVETKLVSLSMNKAAVRLKRLMLGHASDCDMDKNGRINLPPYLREKTGLDKSLFMQLADCRWIKESHNVLIIGPTGVGKTYLACALAHKACQRGYSTRYFRLPRLLQELDIAKADGRYDKILKTLSKTHYRCDIYNSPFPGFHHATYNSFR